MLTTETGSSANVRFEEHFSGQHFVKILELFRGNFREIRCFCRVGSQAKDYFTTVDWTSTIENRATAIVYVYRRALCVIPTLAAVILAYGHGERS